MSELKKLEKYLKDNGIRYTLNSVCGGAPDQIVVPSLDPYEREWDVVCHEYSYGGRQGLLEIMGSIVTAEERESDDVVGWLTAEDVIERIKKKGE